MGARMPAEDLDPHLFWARIGCACGARVILETRERSDLDAWINAFTARHEGVGHEYTTEVNYPFARRAPKSVESKES